MANEAWAADENFRIAMSRSKDAVSVPDRIPFWSIMIPTYNCADYLKETLRSVLDQDFGNELVQIEVVDDCSHDDPESVVDAMAPDRVSFFRHAQGVGAARNFAACASRARGKWVHILHGDDTVKPGFYREYKAAIDAHPDVGMVCGDSELIDENSRFQGPAEDRVSRLVSDGLIGNARVEFVAENLTPVPSAVIVAKSVYEDIGSFNMRLSHATDWEMWMRIASAYPIAYVPTILTRYRVHAQSDTGRQMLSAENVADSVRALKIGLDRLSESEAKEAERRGLKYCAQYAHNCAERLRHRGLTGPGLRHRWWALRLDPGLSTSGALVKEALAGSKRALRSMSAKGQ